MKTTKYAGWYEIEVVGDGRGLQFNPGVSACGEITDGVAFQHDGEGTWVISMSDLREMVRAAERARDHHAD